MRYIARVPIEYIKAGTGELCNQLGIKLTRQGDTTVVEGNILSLISLFTALANYYQLSLAEIKSKFA